MPGKRRVYGAPFKAKVALAAAKERQKRTGIILDDRPREP